MKKITLYPHEWLLELYLEWEVIIVIIVFMILVIVGLNLIWTTFNPFQLRPYNSCDMGRV